MAVSAECRETSFGAKELESPRPDSFRTYFPGIERVLQAHPGIPKALINLGGRHLIAGIGYGSSFNGESSNSLMDFMLIVDDTRKFHDDNKKRRPQDYDPVFGSPRLQSWLNHFSINLYPSSIELDGQTRRIKYAVVGLEDFLTQARSGMRGREGISHLYTAGRLQKAMLMLFVVDKDPQTRESIDQAINQARIDGVWLTMALLPERFTYEQFINQYAGISYMADKRIEKPNKPKLLVDQSENEYVEMMTGLLGAFEREHILEITSFGEFRKIVSLPEEEVRRWLRESAWYSFRINYLKNILTYGPIRAFEYSVAKVIRSRSAASLSVSETRNSPIRGQIAFVPEKIATVVHKRLPALSPTMLTAASAVATLAATTLATVRNLREETSLNGSKTEAGLLIGALALDFEDGALAREFNRLSEEEAARVKETGEEIPEKHNTRWGGMWDALNDRWGAAVMGISRIIVANQKGNKYGELMATLATLAQSWPSYFRARGESNLEVFPESGRNILEFFGTHAGRTLLAIPATLYPFNIRVGVLGKEINLTFQEIADTVSATANIVTTIRRIRGGTPMELPKRSDYKEDKKGDQEYQQAMVRINKIKLDADLRQKALLIAGFTTTAAVLGTHFILRRKK